MQHICACECALCLFEHLIKVLARLYLRHACMHHNGLQICICLILAARLQELWHHTDEFIPVFAAPKSAKCQHTSGLTRDSYTLHLRENGRYSILHAPDELRHIAFSMRIEDPGPYIEAHEVHQSALSLIAEVLLDVFRRGLHEPVPVMNTRQIIHMIRMLQLTYMLLLIEAIPQVHQQQYQDCRA